MAGGWYAAIPGGHVPFLVDLGGLEVKPTHLRDPSRSAARLHPGQVAGINRNRWPLSSGLGGWFAPDWVGGFARNAHRNPSDGATAGYTPRPPGLYRGYCLGVLLARKEERPLSKRIFHHVTSGELSPPAPRHSGGPSPCQPDTCLYGLKLQTTVVDLVLDRRHVADGRVESDGVVLMRVILSRAGRAWAVMRPARRGG